MRILHTADLHLGRQFNGLDLELDHQSILDQIITVLISEKIEVLIVAGDVFDRATPPASAVRQLNLFLTRVSQETTAAVVLIAGNHDSGDRIAAMSVLTDGKRALIRGVVSSAEMPMVITDSHGPVAFSGLPFAYEYAAKACFSSEEMNCPEDVLKAQIAAARANLPSGVRWVVVAHAFVAGGTGSDSERSLARVGGIEVVNPDIFHGAHYVALGHLHRPQFIREGHIRYSGSPLMFGFDEVNAKKSMCLVDLSADGSVSVVDIPFQPLRGVRTLTGEHAQLLMQGRSNDFIKVVLTDKLPIIDGMKRLREKFPNACLLSYQRDDQISKAGSIATLAQNSSSPIQVVRDFVDQVRGDELSSPEESVVTGTLHSLGYEESVK